MHCLLCARQNSAKRGWKCLQLFDEGGARIRKLLSLLARNGRARMLKVDAKIGEIAVSFDGCGHILRIVNVELNEKKQWRHAAP